jgi:hypothetical protein
VAVVVLVAAIVLVVAVVVLVAIDNVMLLLTSLCKSALSPISLINHFSIVKHHQNIFAEKNSTELNQPKTQFYKSE